MEAKSISPEERRVRVFVSSTFMDMQEEREILIKKIFPQLRKLCEERAVSWTEVDLRWGITDEQKAEGRVLPLCLEEIQRCRPYFIGILGDRYGWVPEADSIAPQLLEAQPWLKEHLEKSVTELEILHGVFNEPSMRGHGYFYFRKSDGRMVEEGRAAEKLRKLKEKIREGRARHCCQLREAYATVEELGEWVLDDFTKLIVSLYPADNVPNLLDRQAAQHEAYARNRRLGFVGREQWLKRLDEYATSGGMPLVVSGEWGCGKSALLAEWAARWTKKYPHDVIIQHYVGSTRDSADWEMVVRRVAEQLKRRLASAEEIAPGHGSMRNALSHWVARSAGLGRVIVVLDGLNQLGVERGARQLGWLPSRFPGNFRVIVSAAPGESLEVLRGRGWTEIELPLFTPPEIEQAALSYFEIFSKTPSALILVNLRTTAAACNPLFLRAVLDELRQIGKHEQVNAKASHYLAAGDARELYRLILKRWEEDFGTDVVRESLSLIWAARRGLSESELVDLLGKDGQELPRCQWTPFFLAAESSMVYYWGLLTLSHECILDAVRESYLPQKEDQLAVRRRLVNYFNSRILQGSRQVQEIAWQLAESEQWEELYERLANVGFLGVLFVSNPDYVSRCWAAIEAHTGKAAATAYQGVIASPESYDPLGVRVVATILMLSNPVGSLALFEGLAGHYRRQGQWDKLMGSLWDQAMLRHRRGELDAALSLLNEHDELCEKLDSKVAAAAGGALRGQILRDQGELNAAMIILGKQEETCRVLNENYLLAVNLTCQGTIMERRGELGAAMCRYKEAERILRDLGSSELHSALGNQANIYLRRREFGAAEPLLREEERICREIGNKAALAVSLSSQAHIAHERGDIAKQIALLYEKGGLLAELGDSNGMIETVAEMAGVLHLAGDLEKALAMHKQCEHLCRTLNHPKLEYSLRNQGLIEMTRGRFQEAMRLQQEAERVCRASNNIEGLGTALANQALVLANAGHVEEGMMMAKRARAIGMEHGLGHLVRNVDLLLDALQPD